MDQNTTTDRYISPCKPPEGVQRELATILMEECAEVTQRASKLLRFGIEEIQPGQPNTNSERLAMEVGDLIEVIDRVIDAGIIDAGAITAGRLQKRRQLGKFMQARPQPVPVRLPVEQSAVDGLIERAARAEYERICPGGEYLHWTQTAMETTARRWLRAFGFSEPDCTATSIEAG